MVRRRDWKAMIDAGGSIYLMIKIAGALGVPLLRGRRADRRHDAGGIHGKRKGR